MWGELPADMSIVELEPTDFRRPLYVVQRNLSTYAPWDHVLQQESRPLFAINRKGVDILRVYSAEDSERAYRKSQLSGYKTLIH
jgi:hypothetical protein